jgi:branched-subunit amino acid aminotransferase/4-amino-4-deoxychorismate lyase
VKADRPPRDRRHHAQTQWPERRDRKGLEALKPADVNEIILRDEQGELLLEGTQTNFYAVTADGGLQTAGAGLVLEGTVRRLLLQVCAEEGIPVDETPPRLSDLGSWQGALISSTSRLALPIDWIGVPQDGRVFDAAAGDEARAFEYGEGSLTRRIVALVAARVLDASTPVLVDDGA